VALRRNTPAPIVRLVFALLLGGALLCAQDQKPINPRVLPPPPPPDQPAAISNAPDPEPKLVLPSVIPAAVELHPGTRVPVVLDTPLSTRISKNGQIVTFRTEKAFPLDGGLELPPDTSFTGTVVKVRRPGAFGHGGELRVKVDRINLATGTSAPLEARLDSPELTGQGRAATDNNRSAGLLNLVMWSAQGSLLGAKIHGGKGAAVGAGAGAAIALIMMMSRRGADVYLEPGTPFEVVLDRPVTLAGAEVAAAEKAAGGVTASDAGPAAAAPTAAPASNDPARDPDRPKLKHRSKNPQP
jgi:hypothetical protein